MDVAIRDRRRQSVAVKVGNVVVGGGNPVVVQSMTNTDTADVDATVKQVADLARAGSEIVRITVDRDEAAKGVPHIREKLDKMGVDVPLIGDFHYIGHKLLAEYPDCAAALAKYRINPGNVGFKNKRDSQFTDIVEIAIKNNKAIRIGANWGSLDQELLTKLMEENAKSPDPIDARAVTREAMVQSALLSAARAEEMRSLRGALRQSLDRIGVEPRLRDRLVLAVDEACTNIIRHAYGASRSGDIQLRLSRAGHSLSFELTDRAPCVDAARIRAKPLGECRCGGFGLALIDEVMDDWQIEPAPGGQGNRLTLRKRITDGINDEANEA